jgi:DNA-binding transcriptional regulator YiaG
MSAAENVLTRMYGMLEFDGIGSREEFTVMISVLHTKANISIERISKYLGTTEERVEGWLNGDNIPEVVFMPVLVKKVMDLIAEQICD